MCSVDRKKIRKEVQNIIKLLEIVLATRLFLDISSLSDQRFILLLEQLMISDRMK